MSLFTYPHTGGGGGEGVSVHNALTSIQGGSPTQRYHLTLSQFTLATQIGDATKNGLILASDWTTFNNKWDFNQSTIEAIKVNNAGNADTVNGLTVETAVPVGAVFTDTTYTTLSEFTNDLGFITTYTVTEGDVTQHQAALSLTKSQISDFGTYQEPLVSETNIKTINGQSLLGSGNLTIEGGGGASNHNELNGLQGGKEDEYFHLTEQEKDFIGHISVSGQLQPGDTLADGFIVIAEVGEEGSKEWLCVAPFSKMPSQNLWSTESITTGATSETNGYSNTELLVGLGEEEYPAAAAAWNTEYDVTDGGTRPYLPSKEELFIVQQSLFLPESASYYPWSSTETSESEAWMGEIGSASGYGAWNKLSEYAVWPVRRVPAAGGGSLEFNVDISHLGLTDIQGGAQDEYFHLSQADYDNKVVKSMVSGTVVHEADANVARPSGFASITWIGSVEPINSTDNDIWINTAE